MSKTYKLADRALMVILDGFGHNPDSPKNAIIDANTPNIDNFLTNYPSTLIHASGKPVGLPEGIMGNSEVGHLNIGAGRVIKQDLVKIDEAIETNEFEKLPEFIRLKKMAIKGNNRVHLLGLLSDGGVHSHIAHLNKIIEYLAKDNIKVFLHALMDGRDTQKDSGINFVKDIQKNKNFIFASIIGRFFGMDRDKRWDRVEQAYLTLVGKGPINEIEADKYIENEYSNENYDEFITPTLFSKDYAIQEEDTIFCFNFRPDRAREITLAFADPNFNKFKTYVKPNFYLCMSPYLEEELSLPILFNKKTIPNTLCEHLSNKGIKHFKIAETEKYAHITFFFNGGLEKPFSCEERCLVPSPREVKTYDEKPEMSAYLVCEKLLEKLSDKQYAFYLVNFANPDMVGHTGNYDAAVKAIEAVDKCLGDLMKKCEQEKIAILLSSDHGNSDQMEHENGSPHTAHTTAMVKCALFYPGIDKNTITINHDANALKDLSPTILHLLGIDAPKEFEGHSIFI